MNDLQDTKLEHLVGSTSARPKKNLVNHIKYTQLMMFNILLHSVGGIESALHICRYLTNSAHLTVQQELERTDIVNKLQYTHSILFQLQREKRTLLQTQPHHPLVVCTTGVLDTLSLLRKDLKAIHRAHNQHAQQWFHQWYSPKCTHVLEQLHQHVIIHDLRIKRLLDALPFAQTAADDEDKTLVPPGTNAVVRRHSV